MIDDHLHHLRRDQFGAPLDAKKLQKMAMEAGQPEVRRSFNSPFWPFVLASTSVGQEGIDFHWWCHSVFHWNIPPNPVDFEQREGRVDRYGRHAIRKNIAAAHSTDILQDPGQDPWIRAYELACDRKNEFGDYSPYWVYPGPARIGRRLRRSRSVRTWLPTSG